MENNTEENLPYIFTLLEAGAVTKSGVIFTENAIRNATEELTARIARYNNVFGEYTQPDKETTSTERRGAVERANISHQFTSFNFDGKLMTGEVKPAGDHAENMLKWLKAGEVSFAVRGVTSQPSPENVVSDLRVLTFDVVLDRLDK